LEEEAEDDAGVSAGEGSDAGVLAGEGGAEQFPLFVLFSDGFLRTVAV